MVDSIRLSNVLTERCSSGLKNPRLPVWRQLSVINWIRRQTFLQYR